MVSCYNRIVPVLWGTSGRTWKSFGNVILGKSRNLIVTTQGISLEETFKVAGTDFVSGKDVNFEYKGYWFQWYGAPNDGEFDVYLLKNDWENQHDDPYMRHDEDTTKDGDKQTYYCFEVGAGMTSEMFKEKLDNLVIDSTKKLP